LDASLRAFTASTVLADALGEPLADTIATVRQAEIDMFASSSPEEVVAATRWRH
jgi:glutamine synthetase